MSRASNSIIQRLEGEFSGIKFAFVDVEDNPDTRENLGIRNTPTFLFYQNGQKQKSIEGVDDLEFNIRNFQNYM